MFENKKFIPAPNYYIVEDIVEDNLSEVDAIIDDPNFQVQYNKAMEPTRFVKILESGGELYDPGEIVFLKRHAGSELISNVRVVNESEILAVVEEK